MNIYVVLEGEKASKKIYQCWIPFVNPQLNYVDYISDISDNKFLIISGGGWPGIEEKIKNAILDVNDHPKIDRLIIALDSEDKTYEERYKWVSDIIQQNECQTEIRIVIQHFCIEAWALGNRAIVRKNPQRSELRAYKNLYDVRKNDPELLPPYQPENLNRAKFAYQYLRQAILDSRTNNNTTYRKNNSRALQNRPYFDQLTRRLKQTGHIASFQHFLSAFSP